MSQKVLRIAPEVVNMNDSAYGAVNIAQHDSGDSSGTYVVGVNRFPSGQFVLEVSGNIRCNSIQLDGGGLAGGAGGEWDVCMTNIYFDTSGGKNVGIGTETPTHTLDVSGSIFGNRIFCDELEISGTVLTISGGSIGSSGGSSVWDSCGNDIYYDSSGFVGIGTTSPGTQLEVSGNIACDSINVAQIYGVPELVDLYVGYHGSVYRFYTDSAGTIELTPTNTLDINKSYRFTGLGTIGSYPFYISDVGIVSDSNHITMTGHGNHDAGITNGQSFILEFNSFSLSDTLTYYSTGSAASGTFYTVQNADIKLELNGETKITGNMGIGKDVSGTKVLDVSGDVMIDGSLNITKNVVIDGSLNINNQDIMTLIEVAKVWETSGNNLFNKDISKNVGIGTNAPDVSAALDVSGTIHTDNLHFRTGGQITGDKIGGYDTSMDLFVDICGNTNSFEFYLDNGKTIELSKEYGGLYTLFHDVEYTITPLSSITYANNRFTLSQPSGVNLYAPNGEDNGIHHYPTSGGITTYDLSFILSDSIRLSYENHYITGMSGEFNVLMNHGTVEVDSDLKVNQNMTIDGSLTVSGEDITSLITTASTWGSSGNNLYNKELSGNVGIGTDSPSEALEVSGNVVVSGSFTGSGSGLTNIPNGALDNSFIKMDGVDVSLGGSYTNPWHTGGANLSYSGGNVGIGRSPQGYKLDVNGTVNAINFRGSGANLTGLQSSALNNRSISIDGNPYYLGGAGYTNPWGPGGGNISYGDGNVAITSGGTLTVDGAVTASSALGVAGDLTASSALTVAGDLTASSDLNVGGDVDISGDLEVDGGLTLGNGHSLKGGAYPGALVSPTYAWEFRNGTAGATVYDVVNGVAATPSGGATSTSAGMVFDGSSGREVNLGAFTSFGGDYSIEFYFYYNGDSTAQLAAGNSSYIFYARSGNDYVNINLRTDDELRYQVNNDGAGVIYEDSSPLSFGNWYHVVYSQTYTGGLNIYVNSVSDSITGSVVAPVQATYASPHTSSSYFILGADTGTTRNINGTIAYFRIYDGTALSASDVAALYARRDTLTTPQLDFHVNDQLSLAITDNGLALPQYDVDMKGKYTAASIEPTYAWEFRNATGASVVYDMVGGVAATPSGATSTSVGMGFDGTDDNVSLGSLDIIGGSMTLEILISHDSTTNYANHVIGTGSSNIKFGFRAYNTTDSVQYIMNDAVELNLSNSGYLNKGPGNFVHFVYTTDGTTLKGYFDGVLIDTGTYSGSIPPGTYSYNYLGGGAGLNASDFFEGTISYFRIWDGTALSASDVTRLYAHRNAIGPGLQINSNNELALGITQNTLSMPRYNLVMEAKNNVGVAISTQPTYAWEFRDATGTAVVNDWVGGVTATPTADATSTSEGMVFDGTGDYLQLGGTTFGGSALTVETYFEHNTSSDTTARLFDFYDRSTMSSFFRVVVYGNTISIVQGNASESVLSSVVTTGTLHHVVIVFDSIGNATVYVDDVSVGSVSQGPVNNYTLNGQIGAYDHGGSPTGFLEMKMAFFRIYDGTALSATDVATLYAHRESKAVGYGFNVCGKSALSVAPSAAEVAGSLSVGGGVLIKSSQSATLRLEADTGNDLETYLPLIHMSQDGNLVYHTVGGIAGNDLVFETGTHDGGNTNMLFNTGGGSGPGSGTTRMCILGTGKVGIGTTTPSSALEVTGQIDLTPNNQGVHLGTDSNNTSIEICAAGSGDDGNIDFTYEGTNYRGRILYDGTNDRMRFHTNGNSTAAMAIDDTRYVGIGTLSPSQKLDVAGNIAINGTTQVSSDERIKKNIVDLSDNEALETLRLIEPKKYEYVDQKSRTDQVVYGYIAQQIKDVLPYAVQEHNDTVPNVYSYADISSEIVYTEASDISAVSTVGISTIYVDISNVNTSAEVSMNVVMVEQSDISQNAVFSEAELEDGTKVHKLTFNDGYNTASLHESSNILRVMDASNQEYHITITNIETSYRLEIEEDLSGLVNAQGELFVAGQRVPQNVYKLVFSAFDTATLDASSTTLKLVDASDVTQYVSIASVLDSSTLQIDDDLQYTVLDSSSQLFVYGQKVSKSLTSLTFDVGYNVSDISENLISLKVLDTSGQPHDVKVYSKESESNRLLLDEDISGKISYSASGELFVQGQNMNTTKHILTIQNYDTANLDASSTTLCLHDSNDSEHEVSIVSVIDGSNVEISEDPTSFAHEGQVFVYGQKVDDFHYLTKEYINVVTLSAVQELDRALTKVTEEKDELQTKYDVLETTCGALETKYDALQTEVTDLKALLTTNGVI